MNSTEAEIAIYFVTNVGSIFSMFLGALCGVFLCWGFGRG